MDAATRSEVVHRLKCVEGHVRGIRQMVEEGRPCLAIVQQTQAVQGALRQISLLLLAQHLDGCLHKGWGAPSDEMYRQLREELLALFTQHA